jgi:HEAT repeat protein
LERGDEVPLQILLDIFDNLSLKGLGLREIEKTLKKRKDPQLVYEMIDRLKSEEPYIRESACGILGELQDNVATVHLLKMIDDPHMLVRRAAGFALAHLKDPSSIDEIKRQYQRHANDDRNVRAALECALDEMKVKYTRHPF